ncbi:MAG: ATP-binding cassette domain-containing protein [Caldilineaceae bacterium]
MPIIEARKLTKRFRIPVKAPGTLGALKHVIRPHYEEKTAVDAIDFAIEAGESVAYVGPNGAGKSTTIKMLTGILHPSGGEVFVRGLIPFQQRIANAQNIGVVFGQRTQLWWDLPVQESFRLLGDIYRVPEKVFTQTFNECSELLDLGPLLRKPARQLSLGQRMRCDLAASLLHAPPILYLDEPTIGLDVAVKERIRQFIKRINRERGVTLLLTSHDLSDIEDMCSRLMMIDQGRIVFDGPVKTIKEIFGRERVIHLILQEATPTALNVAQTALPELAPTNIQQPELHHLIVRFETTHLTAGAIASRLLALLPINDLRIKEPSIESIIRQLYEGTLQFGEKAS